MDERVVLAVDADHTLVREAVETYREELTEGTRAAELVADADGAKATTLSVDDATMAVGGRRVT